LQFRKLETIGLFAAIVVGAALAPGTISGDARTLLITFLGLISASILPTISLLVNTMAAGGRSVSAINKLEAELKAAMDALFLLFGCVAVAVGALVALAVNAPGILNRVPYLVTEVGPRFGQALVVSSVFVILMRAGQIPAILRRSLATRHEIAVVEARRQLEENAPASGAMRQAFPTHPEFGKDVTLEELKESRPH
jgi:hypothetical protein